MEQQNQIKIDTKFKLGVVGNGFVGGAMQILKCNQIDIITYDKIPEKRNPKNVQLKDFKECDFIFICVPTPADQNKNCHTGIVESILAQLKQADLDFSKNFVIIRSTVIPGTSDKLNCYFMPEFLTEKNYVNDFISTKQWIIGEIQPNDVFREKMQNLFTIAKQNNRVQSDKLFFLTNKEAEMAKYVRNSFLALKVSFFNEIYSICEKSDVNFQNMMKAVTCDERIGQSHSQVPGIDQKLGFGGTCLPKDCNAFQKFAENTLGYSPPILASVIYRNESIDRPNKEWEREERSQLNE